MKILVLGGAGFIGTNLLRHAIHWDGIDSITVVDNLDERMKSDSANLPLSNNKMKFIQLDITASNEIDKLVAENSYIINFAAQTSHSLSMTDPYLDTTINVIGNLKILESIRVNNPGARYIYISTSTVTGKAKQQLIDEDHGEWALDIYSANKAAAEKHCFIYNRIYGIQTVSLRFANLFGPFGKGFPEFGFINYFISLSMQDEVIPIFAPGDQLRNVMYVEDAVNCIKECLACDKLYDGEPYFAVHDQHLSVREIAETIVEVVEKGRVDMKDWPSDREKIEIGAVKFNGNKLKGKIKWRPKYDFKQGIEKTKVISEKYI